MNRHPLSRVLLLCTCLLLVAASAQAQQDKTDIALRYLKQNAQALGLTGSDLNDLVVTDQYVSKHNGVTHVYVLQRYDEIPVFGALMTLTISKNDRVLNATGRFVPDLKQAVKSSARALDPPGAVRAAARKLDLEVTEPLTIEPEKPGRARGKGHSKEDVVLSDGGIAQEPIPANLVYLPLENGDVKLAWAVGIYSEDAQHYWQMFVDASTGEVLREVDLVVKDHQDVFDNGETSFLGAMRRETAAAALLPLERPVAPAPANGGASYRVYPAPIESPSHAGDPTQDLRELVSNPADPMASALGWHDDGTTSYTVTRGNNVHAYTDIDADGVPDPGSDPDGGPGLDFDFPVDFTQDPSTYRPAAVTNLFYWNNLVHDIAYQYGFDEASGNFQVNNFGKGGVGDDDVRAEAQDGSGTNNANFFTPADGSRPRMQMFRWTSPREVTVNAPATVAGTYPAGGAGFGAPPPVAGITGDLEVVDDGTALGSQGCNALVGFTPGKIAVIDRGSCEFGLKVLNAENAGAIAAIVVNNQGTGVISMGGGVFGGQVTIPSVMLSQSDGNALKIELAGGSTVNATLKSLGVDRDSDFDNGVIVHEYAHGISIRLTGGPSQTVCLANFLVNGQVDGEQMGEGWSDYYALMLTDTDTDNRGIGTYAIFEPPTGGGIRPYPYSTSFGTNPSTYATINDPGISVPHGVGSVWATMLWDMTRALVDRHGFDADIYAGAGGNNLALQLVTDGLKMQPCFPGFVDGRNAILAADEALTGGSNQCLIWDAFASRGLGYSADQGFFFTRYDGTEAFDLPASCCTFAILEGKLGDLQSGGTLDKDAYTALAKKLSNAQKKVGQGNPGAAVNIVMAFINEVEDLVATGVLSEEQGQDLTDCARGVISRIEQDSKAAGLSITASPSAAADVMKETGMPESFAIDQNYPNPFNPSTEIRFALPEATHVRLVVYDVVGREVARLVDRELAAGFHQAPFDGSRLPSGVYFYRIDAGPMSQVKQMVLIK